MKKINLERITLKTYELVKDIDQKLDYLIRRESLYKNYDDKNWES